MGSRVRDASARVVAMKPELSEVREAALALPAEAREQLIEDLAASLGGVMLDAEEEAMVLAGLAEADRGEVIDGETFLATLRRRVAVGER